MELSIGQQQVESLYPPFFPYKSTKHNDSTNYTDIKFKEAFNENAYDNLSQSQESTQSKTNTRITQTNSSTTKESSASNSSQKSKKPKTFAQILNKETKDLWEIIYKAFNLEKRGSKAKFISAIKSAREGHILGSEDFQRIVFYLAECNKDGFIEVVAEILQSSKRRKSLDRCQYDNLAINKIFGSLIDEVYLDERKKIQHAIDTVLLPYNSPGYFLTLNYLEDLIRNSQQSDNFEFTILLDSLFEKNVEQFCQTILNSLKESFEEELIGEYNLKFTSYEVEKLYHYLIKEKPLKNAKIQ